ncbi:hypothetical protein POJ06DRAFT_253848 [Lipomyces tetrasporus]|uniref:Uncharacterized protein n=1 Tax=Lipomyces tetrasporus TaxID=54092 RepID=A0AAD7VSY9_9ASCO|nr:uncharacterized protein POJ06DRAFT_253848 [Lipomyces tetrasporus]KAJ8099535.1 hypothetical protein POJ06DRAFT_253848 [Lipomyces tetrasporus]
MIEISSDSIDLSLLKEKSVLITGGASGLGRETAFLFANAGAYVTIADIQSGDQIVEELRSKGHKAQYIYCDVISWESQVRAFQSALAYSPTKSLDVVAIFAGIDDSGHLVDSVLSVEASIDGDVPKPRSIRPIEVNLIGTYYTVTLSLHYARLDAQVTTKSIIMVASLAGYVDDTHDTVYTASKFGVRGLFRAIRARAKDDLNVRCNLIAPWAMKTPMLAPILDKMKEYGIEEGKGITFAKPETLTSAVARIAIDESISGRAFAIVPEGAFDIGDDVQGGYGGAELQRLMRLRKEAGDFLSE